MRRYLLTLEDRTRQKEVKVIRLTPRKYWIAGEMSDDRRGPHTWIDLDDPSLGKIVAMLELQRGGKVYCTNYTSGGMRIGGEFVYGRQPVRVDQGTSIGIGRMPDGTTAGERYVITVASYETR